MTMKALETVPLWEWYLTRDYVQLYKHTATCYPSFQCCVCNLYRSRVQRSWTLGEGPGGERWRWLKWRSSWSHRYEDDHCHFSPSAWCSRSSLVSNFCSKQRRLWEEPGIETGYMYMQTFLYCLHTYTHKFFFLLPYSRKHCGSLNLAVWPQIERKKYWRI